MHVLNDPVLCWDLNRGLGDEISCTPGYVFWILIWFWIYRTRSRICGSFWIVVWQLAVISTLDFTMLVIRVYRSVSNTTKTVMKMWRRLHDFRCNRRQVLTNASPLIRVDYKPSEKIDPPQFDQKASSKDLLSVLKHQRGVFRHYGWNSSPKLACFDSGV